MHTQNKEEHGNWLHLNGWGRAAPGQNHRLRVRPASPLDIPAIADLLGRLSERSRRLRYFTARPFTLETARNESGRIVQRGATQGFTLLGTIVESDAEAVVAVAELARDPARPHVGELAVVVRDNHQARGVGHLLTSRLLRIAVLHGVTTLRRPCSTRTRRC